MKLNYTEPKIYTGGVDINSWTKLSKTQQKEALKKDWYVYYSFRNPKTQRLVRQTNIKGGVNRYSDKRSRYHILKTVKKGLEIVLSDGFNPYQDNMSLEEYLKSKSSSSTTKPKSKPEVLKLPEIILSIEDAFNLGLTTKENILNSNSYPKFRSRINRFNKWLNENNYTSKSCITTVTKKVVIHYLNSVLQNSSPRNRNNARTDIASFFQVLVDNDVLQENFVKKINVLKAVPERNKTYTPKQQKDIYAYLKSADPILYLFVQFVSYNFLRPIEVCRLKVGDLDLVDRKLYVRAKNQPVKIKIIPDILIKELPDLKSLNNDALLFTPHNIGDNWDANESNRRDYFTKRFKKIKDHFGLGKDYGLYSFRHTFITKLYKEMAKTATPFEVKSKLQLITGHATMKALEQYLRDIDAVLPEDYSKLLK
ncbi:tyrosine-type recombinase/integrase [Lacinutrix sp. WUR7]|uniref:tyrosine-type recombinase/integrase n=1 Tax=Lacinutrix sp. WUR7 TaxID=2653681 RepID=UPI001EF0D638|nr:tyrosine-type recombinase/integrase [Lacinutrix sp. WUR7]